MATEKEIADVCYEIIRTTRKRPTVRAVAAFPGIHGGRAEITKMVTNFNKNLDAKTLQDLIAQAEATDGQVPLQPVNPIQPAAQEPKHDADKASKSGKGSRSSKNDKNAKLDDNFKVPADFQKTLDSAEQNILQSLAKVLQAQEAKAAQELETAVSAAKRTVFETQLLAEKYDKENKSLKAEIELLKAGNAGIGAVPSTEFSVNQANQSEAMQSLSATNAKLEVEVLNLKQSLVAREEMITKLQTEVMQERINASTAQATLASKNEELTRVIKERDNLSELLRSDQNNWQNKLTNLQMQLQGLEAAKATAEAESQRAKMLEARIQEYDAKNIEYIRTIAELRAALPKENIEAKPAAQTVPTPQPQEQPAPEPQPQSQEVQPQPFQDNQPQFQQPQDQSGQNQQNQDSQNQEFQPQDPHPFSWGN